jgi:hypothetical protein
MCFRSHSICAEQPIFANNLRFYSRIHKTVHILRTLDDEEYRRRMGRELNKGEASHELSRFLCFGKEGALRGREFGDQLHIFSCLSVLHNAVVAWNMVAGPRVDLDDLLLFQFVLHAENKPCIVRAELEIVDDCPFDLRSERSQYVRYQIVGERPFLLRALHEHRDRRPNALIDEDDESLFLVAKKTAKPSLVAAMARMCTSTTGLLILFAFTPRSELLSAPLATQRLFQGCLSNRMYHRI